MLGEIDKRRKSGGGREGRGRKVRRRVRAEREEREFPTVINTIITWE